MDLAAENPEMELANGVTETAIILVVYGNNVASQRKDNSNFTFTKVSGDAAVDNKGVVTAAAADSVISVTLTGYANVEPAYIYVTVG